MTFLLRNRLAFCDPQLRRSRTKNRATANANGGVFAGAWRLRLRGAGRQARSARASGAERQRNRPARGTRVGCANERRTGRRGLAFFGRCGMRTSAAPRHANSPPRLRPIVRRLSYELRIASVTLARSLSRRTRHPPPHTQIREGVSPRRPPSKRLSRGRQRTPGIPISPGDPACSQSTHGSRHELMPSKCGEMRVTMRWRAWRGTSFCATRAQIFAPWLARGISG